MTPREPAWISPAMARAARTRICVEHGLADRCRHPIRLHAALMLPPTLFVTAGRPVHAGELAACYARAILRHEPFDQGNEATAYLLAMSFLELQDLSLQAKPAECYLMFQSMMLQPAGRNAWSDWIALRLHAQAHPGQPAVAIRARDNQIISYSILATRNPDTIAQRDPQDAVSGDLAS